MGGGVTKFVMVHYYGVVAGVEGGGVKEGV